MPDCTITLTTLTSVLDDDAFLAEALTVAGVSMLGDAESKLALGLEKRAQQHLAELSVAALHQHGGEADPVAGEIKIELAPPKRHVTWIEPVVLRFPFVQWRHGSGMTLARVPALDLTIMVEKAERIEARVPEEIRFALQRAKTSHSLWRLAQTQRLQEIRLGQVKVTVPVKTPRRAAEDEDKPEGKEKSVLADIATDLTKEPFEPAVELEDTLRLLADTLGGRQSQSVLIVGDSGVGKTAAVHELVRRRADFQFGHTPFWATSGARLVAGMTGFGEWQERCGRVVREAAKTKAILHLGNLVELMSVGKSTHNQQGIASFLRPHLARGELLAMTECTPEQLAVIEREDPHLLNVFAQIRIAPADEAKTRRILKAVAAQQTAVALSRDALDEIVRLHTRYATYSASPGRPLRFLKNLLLDAQGVSKATHSPSVSGANVFPLSPRRGEGPGEISPKRDFAHYPPEPEDPGRARCPHRAEPKPQCPADPRRAEDSAPYLEVHGNERGEPDIAPYHITAAFSRETGLPLFMLDDTAPLDLAALRDWFSSRVIGQREPVETICDLLATAKARLARPRKPLASLLFIGPTGVGKTELAKSLAQYLFGGADRMIRFDMSEFADPLAAPRLIAGTAEGEGLLTARVREQPFCVLLLDEFEKAHPAVFDLLLQVLGDGRLTDAAGRVADFCNAAIILTSNLGAQNFQRGSIGFHSLEGRVPRVPDDPRAPSDENFRDSRSSSLQREAREHFVSEVKKFLRPEMFNRIDAVVPFAPLDEPAVLAIARREIDLVRRRDGIRALGVDLKISDAAVARLARRGFDARYGARPLKRAIERELLVPLADAINAYLSPNDVLFANVTLEEDRLAVKVRAQPRSDAAEKSQTRADAATLCLQLRRKVQRMKASAAVSAIENAVTQLAAVKQKLGAKATRDFRRAMQLDRLPKLDHLLRDVTGLEQRAIEFEADVLARIYEKADVDRPAAEARWRAMADDLDSIARRIFAAQFEQPDYITLCVFGDHRDWVFRLAQAYFEIAGTLAAREGRTSRIPEIKVREILASHSGHREAVILKEVAKPKEFLAASRETVIGIILGISAPLALPRFEGEGGEHVFESEKKKERASVEVSTTAFDDYKPPKGIERPGFKTTEQCRAFHDPSRLVKDSACGTVTWSEGFTTMLTNLLETRLKVRIGTALNILS